MGLIGVLLTLACARSSKCDPREPCLVSSAFEKLSFDKGYLEYCGAFLGGSNLWGLCPAPYIKGFNWEWGYRYELLVETKTYTIENRPQDGSSKVVERTLVQLQKTPVEPGLSFETEAFWGGDTAFDQSAFDQVLKSFDARFLFGNKPFLCQDSRSCDELLYLGTVDAASIQDLCRVRFHYAFQKSIDEPLILQNLEYQDCKGQPLSSPPREQQEQKQKTRLRFLGNRAF